MRRLPEREVAGSIRRVGYSRNRRFHENWRLQKILMNPLASSSLGRRTGFSAETNRALPFELLRSRPIDLYAGGRKKKRTEKYENFYIRSSDRRICGSATPPLDGYSDRSAQN